MDVAEGRRNDRGGGRGGGRGRGDFNSGEYIPYIKMLDIFNLATLAFGVSMT